MVLLAATTAPAPKAVALVKLLPNSTSAPKPIAVFDDQVVFLYNAPLPNAVL